MPLSKRVQVVARAAFVLAVLGSASPAFAVPAFARKYQTSCQTCHIVFPKLNAFGEAFRLRGYRMPGETEAMVKEPTVSLGAPAYKKLWPQSVWPGEISSAVPLAVNVKLADLNTSSRNDDGSVTSIKSDLQFPQEVNIFGAGTLGDHVSYLAEVTFGESPDGSVSVELEHAHMGFDSPFGPEDLFHFRVGKFAPNLVDGFQEMWLSTDAGVDSLFNYNPVGIYGGTGLGAEDLSPASIFVAGSRSWHRSLRHDSAPHVMGRRHRERRRSKPGRWQRAVRRQQRQGCVCEIRLQVWRHGARRGHRRADVNPREELAR